MSCCGDHGSCMRTVGRMRNSSSTLALESFGGFLVTVAASVELPLLPPLHYIQPSTVDSASSHTPGIMSRLIRTHFSGQVRWRPFLQHHEQGADHTHHRAVREYRPRPQTTSKNVDCEIGRKSGHDLVAQQFHLRGNPSASSPVPHPQTVVEVTGRPARQHIPVELASL